jgi:hypothetical protein
MCSKLSTALLAGCVGAFASGCASLLPREEARIKTQWKDFEQAQAAFDAIVPSQTRVEDLKALGFDPQSPNVRNLTYLELLKRFLPNPNITKTDLPRAVRDCLEAKERCFACEVEVLNLRSKRQGNVALDLFGFKRDTDIKGWDFKGLILIKDDVVMYKLASGAPSLARAQKRVKPLGPLQELDSVVLQSTDALR